MVKIEIETDNDAFAADPGAEIARILRYLSADARDIAPDTDRVSRDVRDINGNRVGHVEYVKS